MHIVYFVCVLDDFPGEFGIFFGGGFPLGDSWN